MKSLQKLPSGSEGLTLKRSKSILIINYVINCELLFIVLLNHCEDQLDHYGTHLHGASLC